MQIIKKVQCEVEEVDKIICNKCGCETKSSSYGGVCNVNVSGGYNSTYIADEAKYKFDLCEKCVFELMKTFKHSAFESCSCGEEHHIRLEKEKFELLNKVSPIAGPFKGRVGIIEFVGDGYARVRYEDKETTEYGVYAFEWLELVKEEK